MNQPTDIGEAKDLAKWVLVRLGLAVLAVCFFLAGYFTGHS